MKALRLFLRPPGRAFCSTLAAPRAPRIPAQHAPEPLTAQHIAQVVQVVPQLRQYDETLWRRTHAAFAEQGFSTVSFQRIISGQPTLLTWQPAAIHTALESWRGASQFGDRRVNELLEQFPQLFAHRDERSLGHRLELLRPYCGTAKNIWRLLMNAPNLLGDDEQLIRARIDYVRVQMRAELSDVVKSTAFAHSMDSLRTRHVFLDRLGLYKLRSPKINPLIDQSSKNPRMHSIYDSDDRTFATRVCGVSLDEWEVFVRLYADELDKSGGAMAVEVSDEEAYV